MPATPCFRLPWQSLDFYKRKTHSSSHPHESGDIGSHGNGTSGTSTNGGFRRLVHDLRKGRGWFLAFIFAAHGCRNISSVVVELLFFYCVVCR